MIKTNLKGILFVSIMGSCIAHSVAFAAGLAAASTDLREDYSRVYTYTNLTSGKRIVDLKSVPKLVQEELLGRSNFDDQNFNKMIIEDERTYRVLSFGAADTIWTRDFFVLGVFDKAGKFFGRCITEYGKLCKLEFDNEE